MNIQTKKYKINIPKDTSVIYSEKKKMLTIKGPLKQKSLQLKLKIFINNSNKTINISPIPFLKISNNLKKKIKSVRNTEVALIKQLLIETSILVYQKLTINGIGYRVIVNETLNQQLITLKLGYSHLIYVRIPYDLTITCYTKTKLCIFGNSYQKISQISSLIRKNKIPDPYKGKGFLYENEKLKLKEGKKV